MASSASCPSLRQTDCTRRTPARIRFVKRSRGRRPARRLLELRAPATLREEAARLARLTTVSLVGGAGAAAPRRGPGKRESAGTQLPTPKLAPLPGARCASHLPVLGSISGARDSPVL